VTALLGPRQCGKTTLAHQLVNQKEATFFDIESVPDQRRLQNPELILGNLTGLVVLDEIQAMPQLFQVLRVLVDRPENQARFLILGSASPEIIKSASETLAGRIEFIEIQGFALSETGTDSWESLWLRGGFPRSFLANTTRIAWPGERASFAPSSNATFPNWESISPRLQCAASGPCWRIIMAKPGTPPK